MSHIPSVLSAKCVSFRYGYVVLHIVFPAITKLVSVGNMAYSGILRSNE